jgi:CheY-like chemotaxis protein
MTVAAPILQHSPVVLVAEDDRRLVAFLREWLEVRGYHVIVATDGQEAVFAALRHQPDLILMDLMLPSLTGGEAAQRIRRHQRTAATPIIAMSVMPDATALSEVLPFDGFLEKPLDMAILSQTLGRLTRALIA